jgi:AraC-like DNA-binding protein
VAVVVDTAVVAPEERFELWAEVSAQVFEPLAVRSPSRPFGGRLEHYGLGPLGIFHMTAAASSADRTPALIRAGDPELVQLMLQVRGDVEISQDGRSSLVGPGGLISWQSSTPYRIDGRTPFESVMIYLPASLLRPHTDLVCSRTALAIDGDAGVGAIVRQYLDGLLTALRGAAVPQDSRGHLGEGLLDLVRALLSHRDEGSVGAPERSSDVLRAQINEYIDAHLADADLAPPAIAREHFISRSYLYRLFEDEGESVWETIRSRRLERARRDLVDHALAAEPIFEIASRWGFVSKSHFSRAFRTAYGQSPSDLRRDAAQHTDLTIA